MSILLTPSKWSVNAFNTDSTDSTLWCQSLDNKKHMNNMQKVVVLDRLKEGRNLLLTSKLFHTAKTQC
jgi:hypothetical protein